MRRPNWVNSSITWMRNYINIYCNVFRLVHTISISSYIKTLCCRIDSRIWSKNCFLKLNIWNIGLISPNKNIIKLIVSSSLVSVSIFLEPKLNIHKTWKLCVVFISCNISWLSEYLILSNKNSKLWIYECI